MDKQEKNVKPIALISGSILMIGITALFSSKMLLSEAKTTNAKAGKYVFEKNENPIDINKILKENTSEQIEQEMVLE